MVTDATVTLALKVTWRPGLFAGTYIYVGAIRLGYIPSSSCGDRWLARICANSLDRSLGTFRTEDEAKAALYAAVIEALGGGAGRL